MGYQFGVSGIGVYGTATSGGDVTQYLAHAAPWDTPVFVTAVAILGIAWISAAWAATAAVGAFLVPSSTGEYVSVIAIAVLLHILAMASDRDPAPAAR
jgi:hypothetical protein